MAPKSVKPRLLFISPIVPSPHGPGLAMRPYYQIVGLSCLYSIHLLVAGSLPEKLTCVTNPDVERHCDNIDYICLYHYSGWKLSLWHRYRSLIDKLKHFIKGDDLNFVADSGDRNYLRRNKTLSRIAGMKYDRVHVFRLYLNSVAEILKNLGLDSFYSMDIDDIESATRKSISGLYDRNGDFIKASKLNNESVISFNLETKSLPAYDQIFTSSALDRDIIQNRFPGKIITALPNVVPMTRSAKNHPVNRVFTMLFVGNLGYYPNADALLFFADQIAPVLKEKSRRQWQLRVVGSLPKNKWTKQLQNIPEIKFAGWVEDLCDAYDAADIVVAPIRGGGGTRIKILEAFAHGVPVVSTAKGAEGLEVENGVHLFMEDDARLFADACIRLMIDQLLADEISRRAFNLVESKYNPDVINRIWTESLPESCV